MAYIIVNQNKDTGYTEYICDTIADLSAIPFKEQLFGCVALVSENKTFYIMNSKGQWEVIREIDGGGSDITIESLSITDNGTYTAPENTAYTPITVDVQPDLGTKAISANGTYTASSDELDGYSSVTVDVPANVTNRTLQINGTFSSAVDNKDGYSSVTVDVQRAPVKTTSLTATENIHYEPSPASELSLTIPTIPDGVETDVSAGATITNFDNLRIEFTNKTTGITGHVDVYPSVIATQQIPMLFKNRTLIMGPDEDHYITIVNGYDSIVVLQKGYTITAMKLSINAGLFSSVDVNVAPNVGSKNITQNGNYVASSDNLDGYSNINVNVAPNVGSKNIIENGTYNASSDNLDGYSQVVVDVPPEPITEARSVENLPQPIASFSNGAEAPMPSLKVAIEPQQEGSGDPSPTNVRPISGWTEEVITRTRKNLCNNSTNIEGFYDNAGFFINDNTKRSSQPIKVNPLTTYSGSIFDTDTNDRVNNVVYTEWDKNGDFIQQIATASITTSANTAYIRIRNYEVQASLVQSNHYAYQLEESNESTTYEPYAGTTYTIDLDGTRYGGYIDLANNNLVVNRGYVDLGSFSAKSWTRNGVQLFWSHTIEGMAEGTANVMCSEYKYVSKSWTALVDYEFGVSSNSIRLHNENVSTKEELANSLDGVQLVYELATPLTIQLTPTAIKSLRGVNNVYANTGNINDLDYIYVNDDVGTLINKSITANGSYCAVTDDNADGYLNVDVNVLPNVGTKSISSNGIYNASSDSLDGYSQVIVNVASGGNPDELSSTEPKLKHFTEGGSTYVINSDGSMDWTWQGYSAIGNCFSGQVPLKNAKKIIIEIDEYGENYQHYSHVDTRNFNTAIGVTDIPVNTYINLDNLQTNNHLITDVEFNGNTYYGETSIHREIDLTSYIGQDLYLFIQMPGVTLTGLKVTVLYDKFGVYEYHWSNDGKVCVRKGIGETKWFFIGLTKGDADLDLEATYPELFEYIPKNGDIAFAYAYETASSDTVIGYIGLYYYGGTWYIRSWNSTLAYTMGGTFYSSMDVDAGAHQHTEYSNPLDVEIYDETLLDKTIISNGTYRAEDEGYIGYGEITVAAPVPKADIGYNRVFKDGLTDIYFDANNGKINSYWNKSNPTGVAIGNSIQGRTDLNGTISALHITGNITDSWAYYNSSTLERCQFVIGFSDKLWNEAILVGYNDQGSVYIKEEVELTNIQSTSVDIFINLKDTQYQQYASTPKYLFISLFGIEGEFKVDLIPDVAEIHVPYSSICDCYSISDMKAAVGKQTLISQWTGGTNVGCSWNGTVDLVSAGYKKLHYKLYIGERSYDAQYSQNVRPVIVGVTPTQYQSMQYIGPSTVASVYTDYNMYLTSDYKDVYVEGVVDFSAETDPQYLLIVATGHDCEMLDMWFE